MWHKLRLTVLGRVMIMRVWLSPRGKANSATEKLEGLRGAGRLRSRCYEGKCLIHLCLVQVASWLQWLLYKIYLLFYNYNLRFVWCFWVIDSCRKMTILKSVCMMSYPWLKAKSWFICAWFIRSKHLMNHKIN